MERRNIGVIDIGSNSVHLVIERNRLRRSNQS
jgi:exopolyphosphatase/pppGpp-phosphohydrolase